MELAWEVAEADAPDCDALPTLFESKGSEVLASRKRVVRSCGGKLGLETNYRRFVPRRSREHS